MDKILSEFEGIPLVPEELKDNFKQYGILRGKFGEAVLEKYNAKVKEKFFDNKYFKVFSYTNDVANGSNIPGNVLINEVISEFDSRTNIVVQADLETVIREDLFNLRGTYEYTGLILQSEKAPNEYLAKDLSKQLKDRSRLQYPVLIHLKDLTLRNDKDSRLGVSFNIRENADLIYDKILSHSDGNFSSEDIDPKTGLPSKLEGGNRFFYNRNYGLLKLSLSHGLGITAYDGELGYSASDGRIVVVKSAGK